MFNRKARVCRVCGETRWRRVLCPDCLEWVIKAWAGLRQHRYGTDGIRQEAWLIYEAEQDAAEFLNY